MPFHFWNSRLFGSRIHCSIKMKNYRNHKLLIASALVLIGIISFGCGSSPEPSTITTSALQPMTHNVYDDLLQKHVTNGNVDYQGFMDDSVLFKSYLTLLSDSAPSETWSKDEKLAYWINAYNAFTIKLIADNYPVKSITDLHPTLHVPTVNTVWHKKFFKIGGQPMNLDHIEHKILRKEFEEPRIHFAIVCASKSCPQLLNRAYIADSLDVQLTAQVESFLADPFRNKITEDIAELSKIFSWFKDDFTKKGTLIDFINKYSTVKINENAKISYLKYDWALNE